MITAVISVPCSSEKLWVDRRGIFSQSLGTFLSLDAE